QDDDVARNHICKKTYDECEGLCKDAKDFNWYQDGLHTCGHRRIKNVSPEMLVGVEHDYDKRNHTQNCRECNVTRYVCSPRNQTNQVIDKNEEEYSQQIRHVPFIVSSQIRLTHFVAHKSDHGLNRI